MLTKRIVAALDIKEGRVVKGVQFENIQDAGDPVQLAKKYEKDGVDEIVFLDITASKEKRNILKNLVEEIAKELFIPFTVGGGLKTVEQMVEIIKCGADKVFINTAAVENPNLIKESSKIIGSSNVVVAIDAKKDAESGKYYVYTHGGSKKTDLDAVEWARKCQDLGAGELLVTSMNTDGVKKGYDLNLTKQIVDAVEIPVIASGGAGEVGNFIDVFQIGADAALAASIFHFGIYSAGDLKIQLKKVGINVRL
ncbi:imidazole glycerol phosphate synthase subunit HisF [Petrotoga olearia]|uniref:Imidazole glycerol phosphate synthase subunit HisF n=2 Tax=Petrotoga olearia TaxID=156203 RepID=A0A2K1P0R8_9BACT|nr:imidazole glycerol phosphate synthase subunit HisF [Petrotoga olearia]PNR96350.1 imidazole glycerol phosphate synthase [Petrotoga olearia DSM 13574]RMA76607.1 cyclase [Petrotoga olearia]